MDQHPDLDSRNLYKDSSRLRDRTKYAKMSNVCCDDNMHVRHSERAPVVSDRLVVVMLQTTVKRTLLNFKRTHLDNWNDHKLMFTDDQLAVLTDLLVSPNYYA